LLEEYARGGVDAVAGPAPVCLSFGDEIDGVRDERCSPGESVSLAWNHHDY
jgi:hypothetical protein